MVGAGTIRSDNPSLLPRPKNNRNPWRIIVGENIPNTSKVLTDEFKSQTLLYSGDLEEIIRDLADHKKVMHILCEGGGILATSLLRAKLVDEVYLFLAPKLLGRDGISFYNEEGRNIDSVCKLRYLEIKPINEDLLIRAKIED